MYTTSVSIDTVIDSLKVFLSPLCGSCQIVRSQVNRVPLPSSPCVVLTDISELDLCVPYTNYQSTTGTATTSTRIDIQIDFYGQMAADYCRVVKTAFRTGYGFDSFPYNIKPLFTSDGFNMPLITGEHQYESRWVLTVSIQYNPNFIFPSGSATTAVPNQLNPIF